MADGTRLRTLEENLKRVEAQLVVLNRFSHSTVEDTRLSTIEGNIKRVEAQLVALNRISHSDMAEDANLEKSHQKWSDLGSKNPGFSLEESIQDSLEEAIREEVVEESVGCTENRDRNLEIQEPDVIEERSTSDSLIVGGDPSVKSEAKVNRESDSGRQDQSMGRILRVESAEYDFGEGMISISKSDFPVFQSKESMNWEKNRGNYLTVFEIEEHTKVRVVGISVAFLQNEVTSKVPDKMPSRRIETDLNFDGIQTHELGNLNKGVNKESDMWRQRQLVQNFAQFCKDSYMDRCVRFIGNQVYDPGGVFGMLITGFALDFRDYAATVEAGILELRLQWDLGENWLLLSFIEGMLVQINGSSCATVLIDCCWVLGGLISWLMGQSN